MVSRHARRVRVTGAHACFVRPESFTASLLDLSPLGFSVGTSRTFLPGTILEIEIHVGGHCFPTLSVVRSDRPGGFGVECLIMTPDDQEMMHRECERLRAAPPSNDLSAPDETELRRTDTP